MLVLIDQHIPYIKGIIEPYAEVRYLEPQAFTNESVKRADALIIRTRTRCDRLLLDGSSVRFIATATIGYDHIDTDYCRSAGIFWTNCPGCNAQGVSDYVEAAIDAVMKRDENLCSMSKNGELTLGVVGVGHVGERVVEMAQRRGFRLLLNDPPKGVGIDLDHLLAQSDVITFHTPLTKEGDYPTWHLLNSENIGLVKDGALIINAARGGVIDEEALLSALERKSGLRVAIDTWEGEPDVNLALMQKANIATYHIAGYTQQGKVNATNMCLAALSKYFQLPALSIPKNILPLQLQPERDWIEHVDNEFRQAPRLFEELRQRYKLR